MLANKCLICLIMASVMSISITLCDDEPLIEFGSLAKINESAGGDVLSLKDAYGKNVNILQGAEKVEAIKLGDFIGGKNNEDYFGYGTVGAAVVIKPEDLRLLFNDNHIAPFATGKVAPIFALVFHAKGKKSTLLVSGPSRRIGAKFWVLMEVDSGLLVAVDKEASKCITSVSKSLGLSE